MNEELKFRNNIRHMNHETNQGTTATNQQLKQQQVRLHLPGARSSLARTRTRESWLPDLCEKCQKSANKKLLVTTSKAPVTSSVALVANLLVVSNGQEVLRNRT